MRHAVNSLRGHFSCRILMLSDKKNQKDSIKITFVPFDV